MSGRLWIKVCGLRTIEAIEAAAAAGADAVGFVFHEASPRHLSPADAARLATRVPSGVEKVAVFLHPSQSLVDAALAAIRPDWIQTDAADLEALCLSPGQRVLAVCRTTDDVHSLIARRPQGRQRFLLEGARSGAGERANWDAAVTVAASGELVLAGGLDAANVGEAIATVRPFGVDVSSGVECSRGVKDASRIVEFVNAARAAHRKQEIGDTLPFSAAQRRRSERESGANESKREIGECPLFPRKGESD